MSAISVGLSSAAAPENTSSRVIVTGLTNGTARPGDLLRATLSTGTPLQSYAWGSAPGAANYGTEPQLVVPAAAADSLLHVAIGTKSKLFSTTVPIASVPLPQSTIQPESGAILIQSIAPLAMPTLSTFAGPDTIILEET